MNEGQKLSEYRVSLAEEERKKEGEKSIFDCVWFSRKTAVLESFLVVFHIEDLNLYLD